MTHIDAAGQFINGIAETKVLDDYGFGIMMTDRGNCVVFEYDGDEENLLFRSFSNGQGRNDPEKVLGAMSGGGARRFEVVSKFDLDYDTSEVTILWNDI